MAVPVLPAGAVRLMGRYFAAVLFALGVAELAVRLTYQPVVWYPAVIEELQGRPAGVLFAGSSRVGSAVDINRFAAASGLTAKNLTAINLGQGFSTIITHALGLRDLAARGLLRGTVVFLEAPRLVPDTSTWRDRWYYTERPAYLLSVIRLSDLPGLWRSGMSLEDKVAGTGRTLLDWSMVTTYREPLRVNALAAAYRAAERLRQPETVAAPPARVPDIREAGGARGDLEDRDRIRAAAAAEGHRMFEHGERIDSWDDRVVADIVRTVQAGGGSVVFFDMPLSSPMRLAYDSETGRHNAATFADAARAWHATILTPNTSFDDAEFPDLWHLSAAGAAQFTDDLVARWNAVRAR